MKKDSIRENQTIDDYIATIQMELYADYKHELSILLVEGSDDANFFDKMLAENVACYESYSGKIGLQEMVDSTLLEDERVIAVRDKDYCDVTTFPERMYAYDTCSLETMLLKNDEVRNGFWHAYYNKGEIPKEEYVINAMKKLAPYSILRKKNEERGLGIEFQNVGFGDLVTDENLFDVDKLFSRLKRLSAMEDTEKDALILECKDEAAIIGNEELYEITNGHDICNFLGRLTTPKKLGEQGVRIALFNSYRKIDFEGTKLYQNIVEYQRLHNVLYVV